MLRGISITREAPIITHLFFLRMIVLFLRMLLVKKRRMCVIFFRNMGCCLVKRSIMISVRSRLVPKMTFSFMYILIMFWVFQRWFRKINIWASLRFLRVQRISFAATKDRVKEKNFKDGKRKCSLRLVKWFLLRLLLKQSFPWL